MDCARFTLSPSQTFLRFSSLRLWCTHCVSIGEWHASSNLWQKSSYHCHSNTSWGPLVILNRNSKGFLELFLDLEHRSSPHNCHQVWGSVSSFLWLPCDYCVHVTISVCSVIEGIISQVCVVIVDDSSGVFFPFFPDTDSSDMDRPPEHEWSQLLCSIYLLSSVGHGCECSPTETPTALIATTSGGFQTPLHVTHPW